MDFVENKTPELSSLVVDPNTSIQEEDKKIHYSEYVSKSEAERGLKEGTYFQGPLRMNRSSIREGYIPVSGRKDILISGPLNLNRAINGDIVVIQLLPKAEWKQPSQKLIEEVDEEEEEEEEGSVIDSKESVVQETGKVIYIIKRNWKPYCGSLDKATISSNYPLFKPVDKAIPKIRIKTKQSSELKGKRIVVVIDSWDINSKYPSGHYVRTLGDIGDKDTETEVILLQHDIPYHPFTQSVLDCLPDPKWTADTDPDTKSIHRRDLRHLCAFSVDPPGCTDIDDALHVRILDSGNYEIGVHIADVTHFVKENTAIDKEAAERCTTVYLVNRRIDMLPKLLGENLCSLMSDVDRYAFSVIWEITPDSNVVKTEYTKSIIRSRASLTYEAAQLRIDDKRLEDDISKNLRILNSIAKQLKKKRIDAGAITLSSPEVKFIKDEESQTPLDVEMYQLRETNSMVEEFMLLANIYVAKKIYENFPSFALLRRHSPPNPNQFDSLLNSLITYNIKLDISSSKSLSNSLDNAIVKGNDYFNTLVRILTTRCMQPANYFSTGSLNFEEFHHYGLAAPIYTHFTSPIRRYADDIVHRLLGCAIGVYPLSPYLDNYKVQKLSDVMNIRHKMAQYASRSSTGLYTLLYFKEKIVVQDGYISRIRANGFTVLVPKYGIEGRVWLDNRKEGLSFKYNDKLQSLSFNNGANLTIFQKVTVEITVNEENQELQLLCLNPSIHMPTSTTTTTMTAKVDKRPALSSPSSKTKEEKEDEDVSTKKQKLMPVDKFLDSTEKIK